MRVQQPQRWVKDIKGFYIGSYIYNLQLLELHRESMQCNGTMRDYVRPKLLQCIMQAMEYATPHMDKKIM